MVVVGGVRDSTVKFTAADSVSASVCVRFVLPLQITRFEWWQILTFALICCGSSVGGWKRTSDSGGGGGGPRSKSSSL